MLKLSPSTKVFLCSKHVDMRRSFDALAGLVQGHFGQNPINGHLFVFFNRRRNSMKILFWNIDGFVLYYKRLERGTFSWISDAITSDDCEIHVNDFSLLLAGINPTNPAAETSSLRTPEISLT